MGRIKTKQKRVSRNEEKEIENFIDSIKAYKFKWSMRNDGEVAMNDRLVNVLLQQFDVANRSIPSVKIFGDKFRPEFFLRYNDKPICALECKVMKGKSAKSRWKEGLSQAIHYSHLYKSTVLLLYDFTKDSRYCKGLGPGNKAASQFAKRMQKQNNISIIAVKPSDK